MSTPTGDINPRGYPDEPPLVWTSATETPTTPHTLGTPPPARPAGADPRYVAGPLAGPVAAPARDGVRSRPLPRSPRDQAPLEAAAAPALPIYSPGPDQDDPAAEDFEFITGQMARLTRDPEYAKLQQLLVRRRRRRSALVELTLALDLVITFASLLLAQQYRAVLSRLVPIELYAHVWVFSDTLVLGGLIAVIWPLTFSLLGLYRSNWAADLFSPLRAVGGVLLASFAVAAMLYFLQADRTRWFLLSFTVLDALLVGLARLILRPLASAHGIRRRVLIVGTGRLAVDAARSVLARKRQGFEFVGTVGPQRPPLAESVEYDEWTIKRYEGWTPPRLGAIHDTPQLVRALEVDDVLIALTPRERREASWIISSMAHLPVRIFVLPDVATETAKTTVTSVDGMPLVGLTESAISGWTFRIKRAMDLALTVPVLALLSLLMLAIAAAIRLDSPGPALFKQDRVGQHNRRFRMYKFRTMYTDAEQRARDVAVETNEGLVHKRRDDPRVTRVGAFLRRTSLDELPQLLNVLIGDMSLVGPRPEMPWIVERYHAWQYRRLLVPQGITGWWQVHGRSDRVLHLHTQDDIYYVRNFSLWLDIRILLMTIRSVLTGKGAF